MTKNHEDDSRDVIENAKALVIDSIAETMDLYGVTRSAGTLYGTMYFEKDMTLDEMREKLGMSKPSMSTGVKKLQSYSIVKQTFRKGTRRQTFVAEKDFFNFFSNFFSRKWIREAKINMDAVKKAQAELEMIMNSTDIDEDTRFEAERIHRQLEGSKPYYKWLLKLVDSIESGEIFEYIPIDSEE
ncbi:GbsR/MarR family transcriptional regulator [Halobacillus sp. ACCC02827]|uniref:choline uptake/conversion transcriptional regulator CudC n=1 Tax=Bacillaceae TaxID=186817 RepID=UPI0002A4D086|nr:MULTISPECIES: transcriptional regulator [Bacillaceae]ELK46939.1 transcriptional regulator [Halobacillus sp. BAB-2008]QHT45225.1 GbsR/MarR family transcriptional regulator [Bacillus sp. SB49]WJE16005.1 GbsR/MarR family transcriptional regulator [Halobacillus sp. ACCC02827]